jgi:hypothetical protein
LLLGRNISVAGVFGFTNRVATSRPPAASARHAHAQRKSRRNYDSNPGQTTNRNRRANLDPRAIRATRERLAKTAEAWPIQISGPKI